MAPKLAPATCVADLSPTCSQHPYVCPGRPARRGRGPASVELVGSASVGTSGQRIASPSPQDSSGNSRPWPWLLALATSQGVRQEIRSCQGPRTRGLRVDCWAAPHALPAPTSQESARNARNAQRCGLCSFHEPFHGIVAWRCELSSPSVAERPPPQEVRTRAYPPLWSTGCQGSDRASAVPDLDILRAHGCGPLLNSLAWGGEDETLSWLPSMKGSVKGMAPALLRVRRRWSVSTSFVRRGAPR
jgi:hypothetical protein